MLKKTFLGVLLAVFVSVLLIAGINFNVAKAVDYGSSGTSVGGIIWENTTWILENSPYIFVDDVTVAEGVTLTIEPGVTVDFDFWSLEILGTLYARGNANNRIKLQGLERPVRPGLGGRIVFQRMSTPWNETTKTGCIIEYAEIGLLTHNERDWWMPVIRMSPISEFLAFPKISNNLIWNYRNSAAIFIQQGIIANNTIIGGRYSIAVEQDPLRVERAELILHNIIKEADCGIFLEAETNVTITGNLIINNTCGVHYFRKKSSTRRLFPYLSNNTITKNKRGLEFFDLSRYSPNPTVVHNNIHNNEYNVYVHEEDPQITINMTYNWWGTISTSLIDEKIWDQKDNRRLCLVNYTSFLTSPAVSLDSSPPVTIHDYDGLWHNTDYFINLHATDDLSGVAETYYRINDGPIQNISTHGHPLIAIESTNNTLEYWSVDNAGNEELPHKTLIGIKLDKTAPTIEIPSRIPENDVEPDQEVKVLVNVTDFFSAVKNVTLSYNLNNSAIWIDLPMVVLNFTTGLYEAIIPGQQIDTIVKYRITAYDNAGNYRVEDNSGQYFVYTVIPEFLSFLILPLFMIATLLTVIVYRRKRVHRLALEEGQKENKRVGEEEKYACSFESVLVHAYTKLSKNGCYNQNCDIMSLFKGTSESFISFRPMQHIKEYN